MGRKIPGAKHRGIKDPEKQRLIRQNSLKGKINAPPSNPFEQEVPKRVTQIQELQERLKSTAFKKKIKRTNPLFKQKQGENKESFVQRMNEICNDAVEKANLEVKFSKNVPDSKEFIKTKKVDSKKTTGRKKKLTELQPKVSKSQKKKMKRELKLKNKSVEENRFEVAKDFVKFGEVVHAPPTLTAPRKAVLETMASRPGKKDLLLKSLVTDSHKRKIASKNVKTTIDKTGKRKDLPNALRRQLEKHQSQIITAYRELKKNKLLKAS